MSTDVSQPLLDSLPLPIAVLSDDGAVTYQNRSFESAFGPASVPWLAGGVKVVAGQRGWLLPFVEGPDDPSVEVEHEARFYRVCRLLMVHTEHREVALSFEDVTSRRQAEQAKSDFTSMIVHDLRGPLSGIQGTLEYVLAEKSKLDSMHEELLTAAVQESERMMSLINELLDFSKIQSGNFVVETEPLALTGLLSRAVRSLQSVAARSGVSLLPGHTRDLPMILGNAEKLTQALINLLSNALKFTPERGVISVSGDVIRSAERIESVVVSVTDSGIGIQPNEIDELFQKYKQAGSKSLRGGGGTGLGLYIVKQIVEAHGGEVEVSSLHGIGTSVVMRLPIRRAG